MPSEKQTAPPAEKQQASPQPPAKPRRAGRPKGVKNQRYLHADMAPSSCPKCGSTNREKYLGTPNTLAISGTRGGHPYNRIVWRRTRCRDCGQVRMDRSYEYDPAAK